MQILEPQIVALQATLQQLQQEILTGKENVKALTLQSTNAQQDLNQSAMWIQICKHNTGSFGQARRIARTKTKNYRRNVAIGAAYCRAATTVRTNTAAPSGSAT